MHIAVVVREDGQGARDDGVASELFAELTQEGGGRSFAGVDLAAGEFPFETEMFVRGALGHEDQAGRIFEDGAGDGDGWGGGHAAIKARGRSRHNPGEGEGFGPKGGRGCAD